MIQTELTSKVSDFLSHTPSAALHKCPHIFWASPSIDPDAALSMEEFLAANLLTAASTHVPYNNDNLRFLHADDAKYIDENEELFEKAVLHRTLGHLEMVRKACEANHSTIIAMDVDARFESNSWRRPLYHYLQWAIPDEWHSVLLSSTSARALLANSRGESTTWYARRSSSSGPLMYAMSRDGMLEIVNRLYCEPTETWKLGLGTKRPYSAEFCIFFASGTRAHSSTIPWASSASTPLDVKFNFWPKLKCSPTQNVLNGCPPIFVINLDRSPKRLFEITNELKSQGIHAFTRVSAVDGGIESHVLEQIHPDDRDVISNMEHFCWAMMACTLSHLRAIRNAYEAGHERILIFEDDLTCEFVSQWKRPLAQMLEYNLPDSWEIIQLASRGPLRDELKASNAKGCMTEPWRVKMYATHALAVNREGMRTCMKRFCSVSKTWRFNLNLGQEHYHYYPDHFLFHICQPNAHTSTVPWFGTAEVSSNIRADSVDYHKTHLEAVRKEYDAYNF